MAASMSNAAVMLAISMSTREVTLSPGISSNGFRRNGASVSSPRVNTSMSSHCLRIALSLAMRRPRYSVLAGSITRNGQPLDRSRVWQVVVLPLPVTPATNTCLSSWFLASLTTLPLHSLPLFTKAPSSTTSSALRLMGFPSLPFSSGTLRPNSTSSLRRRPTTSFCGSPAMSASSRTLIQLPEYSTGSCWSSNCARLPYSKRPACAYGRRWMSSSAIFANGIVKLRSNLHSSAPGLRERRGTMFAVSPAKMERAACESLRVTCGFSPKSVMFTTNAPLPRA